MKILIVTQSVDSKNPLLGFFVLWLEEFSKHFETVEVICLEKGDYKLPPNVHVHSLGKESGVSKIKYTSNFYRLVWNLRKNYDAVFVHMNPIYVILGGLLWKILSKKIGLWYTHKCVDLKLRIATAMVRTIFSASEESFRLPSKKLLVTGHGISTDKFQINKIPADKLRLIVVGRVSPVKNINKAIDILEEVVKKRDAVLRIVGGTTDESDEKYKQILQNKIKAKGLTNKVSFTGAVTYKEMPEIFSHSDIMIHTSKTGSVDKVVLEALLSGVFVISESDAFRALHQYGMFIDNGGPEKFAGIIDNFNADSRITDEARKWVMENHSLQSLIPKIKKEYERISTGK